MVKALISYRIIKSYCCISEGFVEFNIFNQTFFIFHVEGLDCFALTQLMRFTDLHPATVDLCYFMGY